MSAQRKSSTSTSFGLKDRLKNLLNLQKEASAKNAEHAKSGSSSSAVVLTGAILRSIGPEAELPSRLKHLRDLRTLLASKRLEDGAVETLWLHIQDLVLLDGIDDGHSRRETLEFLIVVCKTQYSKLNLCRVSFFNVIKNLVKTSTDFKLSFDFFRALTDDGSCVEDFEEDLADLITIYIDRLGDPANHVRRESVLDFLNLLKTILKLNAVYFDEEHLRCVIQYVCVFACQSTTNDDVTVCLNVLDVILCYASWPKSTLLIVVTTLCKLVNNANVCQDVWRTARNLLGSHCGHSAVYTMCGLLQAAESYPDHSVLRGAVFFIGMSLWGAQKVENLRHTPCSVLPSLSQALACNSSIVTFEIVVTCQRLIQKYGRELQIITWDLLIQILERIYDTSVDTRQQQQQNSAVNKDAAKIWPIFHDVLTSIEGLYENNLFNGSAEQLYTLIERCSKQRPDGSIFKLLSYRLQSISPSKGNWLTLLCQLADKYYKRDARTVVRTRVVEILSDLYDEYRHLFGDDYIEAVILPTFANFDTDTDFETQKCVVNLLLDACRFSSKNTFVDMIDLFHKFAVQHVAMLTDDEETASFYFENVEIALIGLIDVIKSKWNVEHAAVECLQIFALFVEHLTLQYERNFNGVTGGSCRLTVLKFFLSLRADRATGRLMYAANADEEFASYYIFCASDDLAGNIVEGEHETLSGSYSSKEALRAFTAAVANERFWPCLLEICTLLPTFLLNRTFVLSASYREEEDDVDEGEEDYLVNLCSGLLYLCADPLRSSKFQAAPDNFTHLELNDCVFPTLSALVPYRIYFDDGLQQKLAMTIQGALVGQKSVYAIIATTICILEMPDIAAPMIKDLIRRLSELPSTPTFAIPTFEFLSTLMRMPRLYADFSAKHFEYTFSIMAPYTSPFRFTELIVAMAYQVTFRFFLKVPMSYRAAAAKVIVKMVGQSANGAGGGGETSVLNSNFAALNAIARNVLLTFLAHYTFRDDSPTYTRSNVAKLLFDQRPTKHWIIGDRIVGVTVADAASTLCPSCQQMFAVKKEKDSNLSANSNLRRRYKSAIQRRVTQPVGGVPSSMDDSWISSESQKVAQPISRKTSLGIAPTQMSNNPFFVESVGGAGSAKDLAASMQCTCWRRGFVEITVRHALGMSGWVVRGENICETGFRKEDDFERPYEAYFLLTDARLASESATHMFDDFLQRNNSSNSELFKFSSALGFSTTFEENVSTAASEEDEEGKMPKGVVDNLSVAVDEAAANNLAAASTTSASTKSENVPTQEAKSEESSDGAEAKYCFLHLFNPFLQVSTCLDERSTFSLPDNEAVTRALKNLDRISSKEAQKVGVLYVGPRQTTETEILSNQCGSARYDRFLSGLGELIALSDVDQDRTFIGGLSTDGRDGKFTYVWSDQITQLVFHIATLMPNRESDKACNEKKRHIGNNHVTIVFNESGVDYKLKTISGQFSYVAIVVEPLDATTMSVNLKAKDEISKWLSLKEAVLSDDKVSLFCRQMTMRAELSARIWDAHHSSDDVYLSRSLERLKQVRHIRDKFQGNVLTAENVFEPTM